MWNTDETSQSINVIQAGTYWVHVIGENGCFVSDTLSVIHYDKPFKPTLNRMDDSLFSDADDSDEITWYFNHVIQTDTSRFLILKDTGIYYHSVTNTWGCIDYSDTLHVAFLGLKTFLDESIQVYPNPTSGIVNIIIQHEGLMYEVLDVTGKILRNGILHFGDNSIDISDLAEGKYFLQIKGNSHSVIHKLIKQSP